MRNVGRNKGRSDTGAVTLIQRFGSAANLNIHLHCLVLDGVYRSREGAPVFHEAHAPTMEELQALLAKIITRILTSRFSPDRGQSLVQRDFRRPCITTQPQRSRKYSPAINLISSRDSP